MEQIEKFKSICKDIWYDYKWDYEIDKIKATIFTQDFMNKYAHYFYSEFLWLWDEIGKCMDNLDNIIDYLYENIQESEEF